MIDEVIWEFLLDKGIRKTWVLLSIFKLFSLTSSIKQCSSRTVRIYLVVKYDDNYPTAAYHGVTIVIKCKPV